MQISSRFRGWHVLAALAGLLCGLGRGTELAAQPAPEHWLSLFNGHDLTGWTSVNLPPGTFTVKEGVLVTRGYPTGVIRTLKMYENFILELEWKHVQPVGNSGVFVWSDALPAIGTPYCRCIEVQVLNGMHTANYTSDGDVFALNGTVMQPDRPHPLGWMRCLPSEKRTRGTGEWNHYRIECRNGRITLAVNGKVVSGGTGVQPRQGYICLESEGAETHFRNLRLQELPRTSPRPEEIAAENPGFSQIYNGLDLTGFKIAGREKSGWKPAGESWMLLCTGRGEIGPQGTLWSAAEYQDFQLMCDWHWAEAPAKQERPLRAADGSPLMDSMGKPRQVTVEVAGESGILLRGSPKARVALWCEPEGSGTLVGYRDDAAFPVEVRRNFTSRKNADEKFFQGRVKYISKWNRTLVTVQGEYVTVMMNGQTVVPRCRLPGLPSRGAFGLQNLGKQVEFTNIYVRPLPPEHAPPR